MYQFVKTFTLKFVFMFFPVTIAKGVLKIKLLKNLRVFKERNIASSRNI